MALVVTCIWCTLLQKLIKKTYVVVVPGTWSMYKCQNPSDNYFIKIGRQSFIFFDKVIFVMIRPIGIRNFKIAYKVIKIILWKINMFHKDLPRQYDFCENLMANTFKNICCIHSNFAPDNIYQSTPSQTPIVFSLCFSQTQTTANLLQVISRRQVQWTIPLRK